MTINIITIIALAIFSLSVYMRNCVLNDRCDNLEADLERKDAILADHLAASDELLATVTETELYNASLIRQNAELRLIGCRPYEIAGLMMRKPITWGVN